LKAGKPQQVAIVAVRRSRKGLKVCLIRRKDAKKWSLPKGFVDRGDTPKQAALNEAHEEAGLAGEIVGDALGAYRYKKWKARLTVAVYVMAVSKVRKRWHEMEFRDRRWKSLKDAGALLADHPIAPLWTRINRRVARLHE
jgi:8-oxo-dGTP pyrophosphatase MutT (NUDIX family)